MKRSERLAAVRQAMDAEQQQLAATLAQAQSQVARAAARLDELQRYFDEYAEQYRTQVMAGIPASRLRDFQSFLARIQQAICAQQDVLRRAQTELDFTRRRWQVVAGAAAAVGGVVRRWQSEEQRADARREQSALDEHALRSFYDKS
ncbi:MAG: flagellar export protein FliJ [Steroidobacteraceae bacterium]|nr:flagellar export protein FliJ [Steroidobacteraceae bacterium]MDW8260097.1 flagellar export protein FliJ [Gammaproteobacteria bacterium]